MARSITLTLGAGLGADLGPNFNLTANVGSVTPSTATKTELKNDSVDYIFTDPPFGANRMYSDLNFIAETWLKVLTNT